MTYRKTITVASGYSENSAWRNFEYYPQVWKTELLKNGVVKVNLKLGIWDIDFESEAHYTMFLLRWCHGT